MIKISVRIFLLSISVFILNAQTSGKISGKIIEESSGFPLVGANVIITQLNLELAQMKRVFLT